MDINIDLTKIKQVINPSYFPLLTDHNEYLVLVGGASSGKSYFLAQKILLRIILGYQTNTIHKILVIRKTQNSIRDSIFALFRSIIVDWNLGEIVRPNKSSLDFEFSNGSAIISAGCDDVEKLKSLFGITSIWIEEASQITYDDFKQIILRIRGVIKTYTQIMISSNPIARTIWLYQHFFKKSQIDTTIHRSTYKDNLFNTQRDINIIENFKNIDKVWYEIYAKGEWGVLKDIIYTNFEITKDFPDKFRDECYGLDFGYVDPSTLVHIGIKEKNAYIKQLVYESGLTNNKLIERLKEKIPKKHWQRKIIYADNAEPARIEEINNAGLICEPANKSVKDGIDFCKRYKLHLHEDSPDLIEEVQSYKYRETKDGIVLEEPLKFKDHTCDGFRYGLYTHLGDYSDPGILVVDGSLG